MRFEDLIYSYENTSEKLFKFVGLDPQNHNNKKSRFDPAVSIKNTNMISRYPEFKKEIEYIEKNLSEYLYDFPTKI